MIALALSRTKADATPIEESLSYDHFRDPGGGLRARAGARTS